MKRLMFILLAFYILFVSCKQKTNCDKSSRLLVYITDLKSDSAAIAAYDFYHKPENIWPEVNQAARKAGFEKIQIYRYKNRLVMILQIPINSDKSKMDSIYNSTSPLLKKWATLTGNLQQSISDNKDEKWIEMKEIYHY